MCFVLSSEILLLLVMFSCFVIMLLYKEAIIPVCIYYLTTGNDFAFTVSFVPVLVVALGPNVPRNFDFSII